MHTYNKTNLKTGRSIIYLIFTSISLILLTCSVLLKSRNNPLVPDSLLMSIFPDTPDNDSHVTIPPPQNLDLYRNRNRNDQELNRYCGPEDAKLKVYMYDLPPEFHFGLLEWRGRRDGQIWPDISNIPRYPGGLNLQHSIEYWLTLDLLSSNYPNISRPCFAVKVKKSSSADVIFVPFFSSLSYNRYSRVDRNEPMSRNKWLQNELVRYLMDREEWKRSGGKDHMVLAHHPNSMLVARRNLSSAMFVVSDFGRYSSQVANLHKDFVAPYKHVVKSIHRDHSPTFDRRPILAFFQGAIYRKDGGVIRRRLYRLLKRENDINFTSGSTRWNGINRASDGMSSSKFCFNIAGDTPSSNRLFDAIVSHCVPVIISDHIELPFEDVLDYSEFCIFVRSSDAVKKGFLVQLLRGVDRDGWTTMWRRLKKVAAHFEYHHPSQPEDAVQMIWEGIHRKLNKVGLQDFQEHRTNRFLGSIDTYYKLVGQSKRSRSKKKNKNFGNLDLLSN